MQSDAGILLSLFAGFASFLSPCVFPLLPSYLSFIGAGTVDRQGRLQQRVLLRTLMFVGGFSTIFVLLGVAFSSFGLFIGQFSAVINVVAGLIIIFFGAQLTFNFSKFLLYEKRFLNRKTVQSGGAAFLAGMAFAAGWSPCIGPVLTSILFLAAQSGSTLRGITYLLLYSIGLAVPFLVVGNLVSFTALQRLFRRYGKYIRIACGTLLMLTGLLILFGRLQRLNSWLVHSGRTLVTWTEEYAALSRGIGAAALGALTLLFLALLSRSIAARRRSAHSEGDTNRRMPFSLLALTLSVVCLSLFIWSIAGAVNIFHTIGLWLQFQGV